MKSLAMLRRRNATDAVHHYISEQGARVAAETGCARDRHHLGWLVLLGLRDAPDFLLQIDGSTGESETFGSVLNRSVRCAVGLQKLGVKPGDVISILAPNYLDTCIPIYAGLYSGIGVAAADYKMKVGELKHYFGTVKPKVIFCQEERFEDIADAIKDVVDSKVITFYKGSYTLNNLLDLSDDKDVKNFRPAELDPATSTSIMVTTSGTTGLPKVADLSHRNLVLGTSVWWSHAEQFPTPVRLALLWSPLQWLSAIFSYISSPIFRFTRLQTSADLTLEHCVELINTYKPSYNMFSPTFMTKLLSSSSETPCDLSSFELILLGGSAVQNELFPQIKKHAPNCHITVVYGFTEMTALLFMSSVPHNRTLFREMMHTKTRLVNPETLEDITETNVPGEMWVQGPMSFKGYYNNPEATKEIRTEDNWLRSGDLFYKDEADVYHFVDRMKMMLKYKSYQISPVEVENAIRQHPAVLDAGVSGIPDSAAGDLVVACVVLKAGHAATAQDIKDHVKNLLADSKQLRGGVIFLDSLPCTSTTKVDRKKLKQLVMTMEKE